MSAPAARAREPDAPGVDRGRTARVSRWELAAHGLLLCWFAGRVAWMAVELHPFVPPDEVTHLGRVFAYAKVWGVPDNGPGTFEYGLVDHRPWLYYWVMARSLALNVVPLPDLIFARLLNGVLGLGIVGMGIVWMRDWCSSPWARVLFTAMLTNTLMFTGLSASLSYDNGANFLATAAVLASTRLRLTRRPGWLLAFGALVLAGCLAKRTFLPLGFLLVLLLVAREGRHWRSWSRALAEALRGAGARTLAGAASVVLLAAFVLALYGGNLLHYGKLRPGFDQVVGERNAMQNRVFARSRILERFRSGEIDIAEARRQAQRIHHAGDRGDTLFLLKTAQLPESSVMGRAAYVPVWGFSMLRSSVGYLGHRRALKSDALLMPYCAVLALAAVLAAARWRPGAAFGVPVDAAFLVVGYAFVLMWFVNYPTYQTSRYVGLALQGRYLFPVLVPLYGMVAWSLGALSPARARPWIVAAVAGLYLYGDLPWLLQRIDARWLWPR